MSTVIVFMRGAWFGCMVGVATLALVSVGRCHKCEQQIERWKRIHA